MLAMRY
jgi:hypothetical protein